MAPGTSPTRTKKASFLKKAIIGGGLVVVLIGSMAVLFLDAAAARIVSIAGSRVLGVQTTLDSAHIAILGGTSSLHELAIAQPKGFGEGHMLKVGYAGLTTNLPELVSKHIVIEEINIDGVLVDLVEKDGKVNLQVVADTLTASSDTADTSAPAPDQSATVTIRHLKVTHIKVLVQGNSHVTTGKTLEVTIPDIVVDDLGSTTPVSQVAAQVSGQLISRLMIAIVEDQISNLPSAMANGLQSAVGNLGGFLDGSQELPAIQGAGNAIKEGVEDIGKGIKDIFGGGKPQPK